MKNLKVNLFLTISFLLLLFSNCSKENDFKMPYKTYSSLINQVGENNPTETVLLNEIGISIEWTRQSAGVFKGILSKPIDTSKSTLLIQLQEENRMPTGGFSDSITIKLNCCDRYNVYDSRDGVSNAVIEIKEYNE